MLQSVYSDSYIRGVISSLYTNQANGFYWPTATSDCYVVFPIQNSRATKSWFDARSICLYHGGDLATDIVRIVPKLQLSKSAEYWIGLQRDPMAWLSVDAGQSV